MAAPSEESFREIANLPNLRILWQIESKDAEETSKYVIYRSSRPDLLNEEGVSAFKKLGIENILDFRSKKEYSKANGKKLLDEIYPLHKVNFPHGRNYRPGEPVNLKRVIKRDYLFYSKYFSTKQIVTQKTGDDKNTQNHGSHILIDFFSAKYIWTVFKRAPWYLQLYSLIFLAIDIMFNTGYVYFVRFFARNVLNPTGLIGQYKDMIDMSQRSICSALKLLSNKENYPVFINCAHGKDRTGLVSALVLSCLQLPKRYVSNEYALSMYGTTSMKDRLYTEIVKRFHMSEEFVTAEADTMMKLLNYICEMYGSVENYLECIGFGEKEQESLRNIFGRQKVSDTE
ncbi:hypothetical protein LOTGIDRAFT_237927 [Lottia gigantea]|uniref:Tyrosine specific protein phosphatases domain-containing protein n=1 Tax=Lottia gigantea TaxID=225164 RepID=V4BA11_LOTGI|nr:hypothetical protein LOTGIDRAFT_237927 [Lottia gigantea]ESP02537.1 hypothetical protein LOTGIDRAFT_237927 [Lottia gigantea]